MSARLTYLTMDSVQGGVGASQVLPYVERLSRAGLSVELHSFEAAARARDALGPSGPSERETLGPSGPTERDALGPGIEWHPHHFGRSGQVGGLARVAIGAHAVRGASLVHARSDLAAASSLVARPVAWVWDVRSFWVDQRIGLGMVRRGSAVERALRAVEAQAARRATAITTLTRAAIDELRHRYGSSVAGKARVVTTCVDLDRFRCADLPDRSLRLLLSGSYNALYDLPTMLGLVRALRRRVPADLTFLRPTVGPWDDEIRSEGGQVGASGFQDMPGHVAAHHAGLSICRTTDPRALVAAMPTKIGEFLASGRPVVVNRGLGDCDDLLPSAGAGVVVSGTEPAALEHAADQLLELLADPATPSRCRALAEAHFDLDRATATLAEIYREAQR